MDNRGEKRKYLIGWLHRFGHELQINAEVTIKSLLKGLGALTTLSRIYLRLLRKTWLFSTYHQLKPKIKRIRNQIKLMPLMLISHLSIRSSIRSSSRSTILIFPVGDLIKLKFLYFFIVCYICDYEPFYAFQFTQI